MLSIWTKVPGSEKRFWSPVWWCWSGIRLFLDGVHMLDLSEIGPEIQDVVISSHDGDVLLDNSSIFTPSGSISVTALESTPFGFDGLATGGAIIQVVGASIDGPSPVVPEPSTIALLVVGVVGVMVVRRRP